MTSFLPLSIFTWESGWITLVTQLGHWYIWKQTVIKYKSMQVETEYGIKIYLFYIYINI